MLGFTFLHASQSGDFKCLERQIIEPQDYEQSQAALLMAHLVPKSTERSDEPWKNLTLESVLESICIRPDRTTSTTNSTVRVRTWGLLEFKIYPSGFQPSRLQKKKNKKNL